MNDELCAIVIDSGSLICKAGFANEVAPRSIVPSIVGHKKQGNYNEVYVGDDAEKLSFIFDFKYPIKFGIVDNWDTMEKLLHHIIYSELRVDPEDHPVCLAETILNPKINREKMKQIMFETFNVPSLYIENSQILSLYATQKVTGIVFECGHGVSQIVPIYEHEIISNACKKINFGGHDLTKWFQRLLYENGFLYSTNSEINVIQNMKEKYSYVAFDYESEIEKKKSTSDIDVLYNLPDGSSITLSEERFTCPELLFKPSMNGFKFDGFDKIICDSILECKHEYQNDLFSNIVLSGGTTKINGLTERIEKEIKNRAPTEMNVRAIAKQDREYLAWIGGSVLTSCDYFQDMVITRDAYENR